MEKTKVLSRFELVELLCAMPEKVPADQEWQSRLSGTDWGKVLKAQPGLVDQCPWDELSSDKWLELLALQPQFIDRFPKTAHTNSNNLYFLLIKQPGLHTYFPDWKRIEPIMISSLLRRHPVMATEERLALLNGISWAMLLVDHPDFADRCDWNKLNSGDWRRLLEKQPQMIRFWNGEQQEISFRRFALEDFYKRIFPSRKLDWTTTCMLNELTGRKQQLIYKTNDKQNSMFKLCEQNESAETFVMLSVMDPSGAAMFLHRKIREEKWDLIRRIITLQPALLLKLLTPEEIVPYFMMHAPADLALYAIEHSGTFAGNYLDSCKCNCFHALFLRIAETNPNWFLEMPDSITALYDALIHAECNPDQRNLQHYSYNSMVDKVKKFFLFERKYKKS